MDNSVITIANVGPYYTAWKQEFIEELESNSSSTKIEHKGDQININGQRHTIDLKIDHSTSDVAIHVSTNHRHGNGGGAGWVIFFLLMIFLLFFGGLWFMWFLGPFWLIFFVIIIIGASSNHEEPDVKKIVGTIAENAWQEVQSHQDKVTQAPIPQVNQVTVQQTQVNKVQNQAVKTESLNRLPDEVYLLSPEAAKIAATPEITTQKGSKVNEPVPLYCPYCGARRQTGANFCANCGSSLAV
jgi:hypothetical protein